MNDRRLSATPWSLSMKRFGTHVALSLTLLLIAPALSMAAGIHYFNCTECHKSSYSVSNLATANVCLSCHAAGTYTDSSPAPGMDGIIEGKLSASQASDAHGSNPYSPTGYGTSHIWGAVANNAAAGAQEPATNLTGFYRRYQVSWGKVTCTRCHEPHADADTNGSALNPDALNANAPMEPEQMCRACHVPFDQQANKGLTTHPVVVNYDALLAQPEYQVGGAKAGWLQPAIGTGGGSGTVRGITATIRTSTPQSPPASYANGVGCSSCHGVHAADSDSTTEDGFGTAGATADGDGKLLRADGPTRSGADSAATAQRRSNLCQACHTFNTHGNATVQMGCLDCHSGHTVGSSNYFVLRSQVGATSGIAYPQLTAQHGGPLSVAQAWSGTVPGDTAGYCEKCHGQLTAMPDSTRGHIEGENCRTCHKHDGGTYSFEAGGCDGCHGFPPVENVAGGNPNAGFAVNGAKNYSTSGVFKDESLTPHASHSSGGSNYAINCEVCHNDNFTLTHDQGTFQNVLAGTGTFTEAVKPTGSSLNPSYTMTGSGSCSQVACHSNGGKRTGDSTRTYTTTTPVWANGKNTISSCGACHDNSGAMANNSAAHAAHIAKGYSCNLCHADTATNNTTLAPGAMAGKHVNGAHDVVFNTTYPLGAANLTIANYPDPVAGTCAVYCHSNGTTLAAPDWDLATSGDCGSCHKYNQNGDATQDGSGPALAGAHQLHVFAATGPKLACTICHTHDGSAGHANAAQHVNGEASLVTNYQQNVCNPCHGASNGVVTGDDRQPVWTNAASVDCMTCHQGAVVATIGGKPAPNKASADTTGHLLATGNYPSGNGAAAQQCETCHDANAAGHFDTISGDDTRLNAGFVCTSCHTGYQPHHGKQCYDCHDPHGTTNWYMIYASQATQNAKDTSGVDEFGGNVVLTGRTGPGSFDEVDSGAGVNLNDVCATCHSSTAHNNRADTGTHLDGLTHEGEDCFSCHRPHTDPVAPFSGDASTCEGCHSNLATKGAHAAHMTVTPNIDDDKSECALCHLGADQYTLTGSANGLHRNSTLNTNAAIDYNSGTGTCATACHKSTAGDGFWNDTALDCNSCHYYAANPTLAGNDADADKLSGDHSVHFGAGSIVTCDNCHTVPVAGDTTHITAVSGADQGAILTNRGSATQDEADVTAAALGSGSDPDPGNPVCSNAACHNPSAAAYSATWTVSTVSCDLCHSSTAPASGSHGAHLSAAGAFGINTIACTSCHVNNGVNQAHRNGTVSFTTTPAAMGYTVGAEGVGAPMGTCTTSTCHNNGTAAATAVTTPQWGQASANCSICHADTPNVGNNEHGQHVASTSYVANCGECHTAANATTHINGARNMANKVSVYNANGSCTNTCHVAVDGRDWTSNTSLACLDCHAGSYIGGNNVAKGFNATPATGLHTGTLTTTANTHDDSFNNGAAGTADCVTCHTATPSTAHLNGTYTNTAPTINFAAAVGFSDGATPTCGPNGTLVSCHDDAGTWDRKWSVTAKNSDGTQCANCHGDFTNGFVVGMALRHQTTTSGDPGGQIAANHGGADKCYTCHTYKAGDTTYYNFATQHRNGGIELNNAMGFTDNGATVYCTSCHTTPYGTTDGGHEFEDTTSRWTRNLQNGPAADCNSCHASNGRTHGDATESSAAHDAHLANSYVTGGCTDCHSNAGPGSPDHNNGTVNFGGTRMTTAANYSTAAFGGSCSGTANGCHDSDTATEWSANSLGGDACADCHASTGKLLSQGGYPPTSAEHAAHLNNNTLVPGDCNDCHGANATTGAHTGHINTLKTVASQISLYTAGDGTCTNTCHAVVNGRDWTSATTLDCADCHAASGKSLDQGGYPPVSAKHTIHLNNNSYVPTDCTACHGANAATGAHAGHQDGTKQNSVSYASATQTCTNSCHVANTTGDWTAGGALVCLDCHAGTYIGGGANGPSSGLHTGTMTVSGNTHDDSFNDGNAGTATCVTCHTASPSSAHINGTFTNTAPTVTITANVGFLDGATPTCGPTSGLSNCHDDAGAWKRKWSTTAKNNDGTQCANCHGDFTYGFVTGMVARHQTTTSGDAGGQIASSHDGNDKCYYCHAYKAGDTTYYNFATKHRDGQIQINTGAGFVDNGTTVGCSNCHAANDGTADGQHAFTEITGTRWTRELLAGFSVNCNTCHLSSGRGHADGTENLSMHDLHIASGYTSSCTECHPHSGGANAVHDNGTVNFGGTYMTTAINYSTAAFGGTCAAGGVNGCHDSDAAGDWSTGSLGGDACADCHAATAKLLSQGGYPPTSAEHTLHIGNAALVPNSCGDCHGANAQTGAHTGHKDMLKTTANQVTLYNNSLGTCTNNCHTVVDGRDWTSATTLNCADCHAATGKSLDQGGYPPVSAEHTPHLNNNVLVPGDCDDCHGASATTGAHANHMNGARNYAGQVSLYTSANGTCTNTCHVVADGRDWTSATTLNCADCHAATGKSLDQGGYPPVSAKHTKHLNNNSYVPNDCSDCHGANATAGTHVGHQNGATDDALSYASVTQTCTNSCHVANTTGDWTAGGALVCLDCHSSTYIGGGANGPTSGLHTGNLTVSGNTHDDSFNNGAAGTADCVTCHTTAPSASHINGTFANSSPTITFAANVGFVDGTTPTCGPTSGLASCHDDGGVWKRKWDVSAKNNDGTQCANCHGDFSAGFVTGMAGRHQTTTSGDADGQIAAYHDGTDKCFTCHSYKAGDNTYYNIANSPVGQHRDGTIQINTNVGFADNGASVGCSKCHSSNDGTADEQHEFVDTTSRWTRNSSFNGPPVSCATCHAYPPVPSDGKTAQAIESKGAHAKHVTHIAARAGVTLQPLTDTFTGATSAAVCGVCHDVSTGSNHNTAGGTRNLLLSSARQFGASLPSYNGTVGVSSTVDPKTCSSLDCHFKETPVWAPAGGE